jgi:hypothetical protein
MVFRRRLGVITALVVLALAVPRIASGQGRPTFDAGAGMSFANIGNTFAASGRARFPIGALVSINGEVGVLPHAPFDAADEIAMPLPPLAPRLDARVNGYHFNGNLQVNPFNRGRWMPYATVGLGGFTAESVATGTLAGADVRARRSETDLATNLGAGVTYRLTDWIGLNGEYRVFYVHRGSSTPRISRFVVGVAMPVR